MTTSSPRWTDEEWDAAFVTIEPAPSLLISSGRRPVIVIRHVARQATIVADFDTEREAHRHVRNDLGLSDLPIRPAGTRQDVR